MRKAFLLLGALAALAASPAAADGFQRVTDRNGFVDLVVNRALTRFGIKLQVLSGGQILGRAFGQNVTGDWSWRGGYFCRDLYISGKELDLDNCQTVEVKGNTLRFTSDRGTGDSADLKLN